MIRRAAALGAMALSACAAAPSPGPADVAVAGVPLANAGFEQPTRGADCAPGWSCGMHADPASFRIFVTAEHPLAGRGSLCIERVKPQPWALATQPVFDPRLKGRRVRFSMAVRVEGATGAGGGVIALVHGAGGRTLAHAQRLVRGTRDAERVAVELDVPSTAENVEIGATLEGPGRTCVDDARLEIVEKK